jgi:hypothetical protein
MKLAFLMIILTLPDNGQLSAAFVNTQTLEECEKRASVVRSILDKGDIEIKQMVCRSSGALFEPFVHGTEGDAERYAYSISFDDRNATVEAIASCSAADAAEQGRYCATSTQKLLSQAQ